MVPINSIARMSTHVEAEVKYQISAAEYAELPARLLEVGFLDGGSITQEDRHIMYEPSALGGFDFERIRKTTTTAGEVEYSWDRKFNGKDAAGNKLRLEDSRVTTREEYETALELAPPECPTVLKQRHNFTGTIEGFAATVSLDKVNFGSGDAYFIETEIITTLEHGQEAKQLCTQWLTGSLHINTVVEAPGYLKQYLAHHQNNAISL